MTQSPAETKVALIGAGVGSGVGVGVIEGSGVAAGTVGVSETIGVGVTPDCRFSDVLPRLIIYTAAETKTAHIIIAKTAYFVLILFKKEHLNNVFNLFYHLLKKNNIQILNLLLIKKKITGYFINV